MNDRNLSIASTWAEYRKRSEIAFKNGDGPECTGNACMAGIIARHFKETNALVSEDEAVAQMRALLRKRQ